MKTQNANSIIRGAKKAIFFAIVAALLGSITGCSVSKPEGKMKHYGDVKNILTVGENRIEEYTVVYESGASETIVHAVEDLIKYVQIATGGELRTVTDDAPEAKDGRRIFVGSTAFTPQTVKAECRTLKNNGLAIMCEDGNLYLSGQNDTGAMYAVYTFLEDHLGLRFYSSTFETVKKLDPQAIPEGYCYSFSPKLINRDPYWYDTFRSPHFAAKLKINGAVARNMEGYGDSIKYAGPFVHSLPNLAGTPHTPDVQPCLTDPEIYDRVLENVRTYLRDNPSARIVSVSQNDSFPEGRGCQCENCKALDDREGTPMGSLLTFVNRIAGDIKEEFPDVYVDTLAYRYTRKAPKYLKPAENVIIRLCSIECCFSHPIDSGCDRNKEFAQDLEDWSKICDNLFIWDYTTNFLYYVNPFPNLKVLYDDIRFFVNHHAIGLFEQGGYQSVSGEFGELRAYLIAKLLWDPDMSREQYFAYMDDFLMGYYGDGWQYIRRYIDLSTQLAETSHMGIYYSIQQIFNVDNEKALTAVGQFEKLWEKALAMADEEHYPNVEKSSIQVLYAKLCLSWNTWDSPAEKEKLYNLMKKYNITHFREGTPLPEEPNYYCSPENW